MPGPLRPRLAALATLALLAGASSATAQSYDDVDLALRFAAAFANFPRYTDVAAVGGASTASPLSSSINPAATGWLPVRGDRGVLLGVPYALIFFDEGTRIHVVSESIPIETETMGTIQPSFTQATSNDASLDGGGDFELNAIYGELQWGLRVDQRTAVGANLNFQTTRTDLDMGGTRLARTEAETYGLRLGVLHQAHERLRLGFAGSYAFSPTEQTTYTGGSDEDKRTVQQLQARTGIDFELAPGRAVYTDYDFGFYFDRRDTLRLHRLRGGVRYAASESFVLRAGTAYDFRGDTSWTTGLAWIPHPNVVFEVAWLHDYFPELSPEFGDSETLHVSLAVGL